MLPSGGWANNPSASPLAGWQLPVPAINVYGSKGEPATLTGPATDPACITLPGTSVCVYMSPGTNRSARITRTQIYTTAVIRYADCIFTPE